MRTPTRRPTRRPDRRPQRRDFGTGASPAGSVTFPATSLDARVYIALGADLSQPPSSWIWEDITRYVRFASGVGVTTGRRDEASTVGPGSGYLTLDNRDGRFCRRNPASPYYGLLSKNTPIWGTVDAGSGVKTRLQHFVNEWPTRWDKSGNDCTVLIRTAGILRRLGQGVVLKSPLRRAIVADSPAAYWPMEEGSDATVPAPLVGSPASVVGSGAAAGSSLVPAGSSAAWTFESGGALSFPTGQTAGAAPNGWEFELCVGWDTLPTIADNDFLTIAHGLSSGDGMYSGVGIGYLSGVYYWTKYQIAEGGGSVGAFLSELASPVAGRTYHVRVRGIQAVPNMRIGVSVDGVDAGPLGFSGTLQMPLAVVVNAAVAAHSAANVDSASHLAFWAPYRSSDTTYGAADGYSGELAHDRIRRICSEESIPYKAASASTVAMGPQSRDKALAILREAEAADMGSLYEIDWGLGFQSTLDRYNAPVLLTLDFNQGNIAEPPQPADDDQRTRNKVTASRSDGSEYTAEQTDGPMGTGAQGPGVYDDSVTVNVETDSQLPSQAGWRVHLGTVDEDRWPRIDLNFARSTTLIDTWTALPYGARINATNPPDEVAPDTIDAIIEGYSERWDTKSWTASLNTSPASPYRVHVVASTDGNLGRVDAANSTLAADGTSSDTSLSVASTGALWRTGAVNFDIGVLGERITVTNISGGFSPQTFTVTRSVNGVVKALPATVGGIATKVSLWKPGVYAL